MFCICSYVFIKYHLLKNSPKKVRRTKCKSNFHFLNGTLFLYPDGMNALFTVEKCPEPVTLLTTDLHNDDEDGEDLFNIISVQPKKPQVQARANRGEQFKTWKHYIAIEEVTWDYTPHLEHTDR